MLSLEVESPEAQEALGATLAGVCPPACVIYLEGDLGAGKTTLVRGFIRALGHQGAVKSPTYTLLEPYDLPGKRCYHFDLYRLGDPGELEYLGIRDLMQEEAILVVEWPERGQGELPPADLVIHIRYRTDGRDIQLEPLGEVGEKLLQGFADQGKTAITT